MSLHSLTLAFALLIQPIGLGQAPGDESRMTIPGYPVGEFREPSTEILTTIDGDSTVLLYSLIDPGQTIEAPVRELKLVSTTVRQSRYASKVAQIAYKTGKQGLRNRNFYRHPRIACAAYVSYVLRKAGFPGGNWGAAVNPMYARLRRTGRGRLVASKVSTRYTTFYRYYRPGDLLFFHRGRRLGHVEIYVGNGLTSGTSSSALRLGVRRVGNRGFTLMSVVRI